MKTVLSPLDHDRDSSGMKYVYPVVSRRAGGVSVGINLNPNNACNWACVYCQVPNLVRGTAPELELALLERELRTLLTDILHGDFMSSRVPVAARRLNDIALSGNGEPTSSRQFDEVIERIGRVMAEFELIGKIKLILITNGSLIDRPRVRQGLQMMAGLGGEVWFKLDTATSAGLRRINQTRTSPEAHYLRLATACRLCPTWLQTCLFAWDGSPPSVVEREAYLAWLRRARGDNLPLAGVLLYGLARPSLQPAAPRLSALPASWLEGFAEAIRAVGFDVKVSP